MTQSAKGVTHIGVIDATEGDPIMKEPELCIYCKMGHHLVASVGYCECGCHGSGLPHRKPLGS